MMCFSDFARPRVVLVAGGSLLLGALGTSASAQDFDLEFDIQSSFTTSQLAVFDEVESTYESLFTGFQPGVSGLTGSVIAVTSGPIDGPINFEDGTGGTAGMGGGSFTSDTPTGGFQFFNIQGTQTTGDLLLDEDDLDTLEGFDDGLFTVIFHEVGHALGFGTLWEANNLLDDAGQYIGDSGLAAFQEEFDLMTASFVPTDSTGAADDAGHWDEDSVLGDDVLSPILNLGGINDISDTTIASFADLGFTVVPEPASAALLVLGGSLLIGRRRRSA